MSTEKLLVEIIMDKNADWAEKQDALFDSQDYGEPFIGDALLYLISDDDEDYNLRCDACETLASVWVNSDKYDLDKFSKIPQFYKERIIFHLKDDRPDWIPFLEAKS